MATSCYIYQEEQAARFRPPNRGRLRAQNLYIVRLDQRVDIQGHDSANVDFKHDQLNHECRIYKVHKDSKGM